MAGADIKASLPLQIALYFHGFYAVAFFLAMLVLFIYKGVMLPYPPNAIGLEVAFVFFYGIVEWVRIRLASRGNRLESPGVSLAAVALAVPVVIFHVYAIRLQTYVLRLDQIINGIALAFVGFETLLGGAASLAFWRAARF